MTVRDKNSSRDETGLCVTKNSGDAGKNNVPISQEVMKVVMKIFIYIIVASKLPNACRCASAENTVEAMLENHIYRWGEIKGYTNEWTCLVWDGARSWWGLTEAHLRVAGLALPAEAAAGWGATAARAGLLPSTTADWTHWPLRPRQPRTYRLWGKKIYMKMQRQLHKSSKRERNTKDFIPVAADPIWRQHLLSDIYCSIFLVYRWLFHQKCIFKQIRHKDTRYKVN